MASTIGIKIANGDFYSILEENSRVKKRLVLTTVHDHQKSAQIDLYRSYTKTMADALYIGSLVIENISPKTKGEPSIELIISSHEDGEITADAYDLDTASKEHQYLNVSLKSFDDETTVDIPDFELEESEAVPPPQGLYEKPSSKEDKDKKRTPLIIVLIVGLILILLCLLLWFFFFRGKQDTPSNGRAGVSGEETSQTVTPPPVPPAGQTPSASDRAQPSRTSAQVSPEFGTPGGEGKAQVQAGPAAPRPDPPVEPAPGGAPPVITAPDSPPAGRPTVRRARPVPPVSSYKVPAVIPKNGVVYRIRWGDTLWDIAEAFYRNPWLYPRIARYNNIRNPDLIISGTSIRVPPR
ncbi:MAG: LysM peptidoglycan-binding domain-containing protein [Treponema sp.]|jgi:LysM repeat protein|nr:LysM peptidoglycan-binding domain-containing protein [Treponema sp.]